MKKNLFLRLCLMMVTVLSLNSCRQDLLPEQETYNNSSKFQLTSKRISLNDAKHKAKLLLELQKAEKEVEKQKLNIHGKLVNVGNGINIDTDNVIYMVNGPDFHTYTFSVIRDNASPNSPVENILMAPQADGSYRVFHIALNLTEADKTKIANRQYVDYKNKEQVTELANINLSSLNQKQMCIPHYYSIPVSCTGPEHHMPGEAGCPLEGNDRAYWASIVTYDCFGEQPATIMPTPTPVNGGGGGGGECPDCPDNSTPKPCIQIATDPTQVGIVDPNGCIVGMPTNPNLPLPTVDPCRKAKASITAANDVLKNPTVQSQMDAVLKGKISASNEWSIAIGQKPNNEYEVTPPLEGGKTSSTSPNSQLTNPFVGNGHSHAGLPGDPSGGDIYALLERILLYPDYKFTYTYGINNGQTEVYALVLNDKAAAIQFLIDYPRINNYDPKTHSIKTTGKLGEAFHEMRTFYSLDNSGNTSGENYQSYAVATAYILDKFSSGISVAKVDINGNLKKINASFEKGGIMGKKAIVSKCP